MLTIVRLLKYLFPTLISFGYTCYAEDERHAYVARIMWVSDYRIPWTFAPFYSYPRDWNEREECAALNQNRWWEQIRNPVHNPRKPLWSKPNSTQLYDLSSRHPLSHVKLNHQHSLHSLNRLQTA